MKIAILTPGGVDRSGTERVIPCILWLIERLVRAGDEVHVFAFNQEPLRGRWQLLGAEVHNAGRRPRGLTLLSMLLAEHRRGPFDVLHAFWAVPAGMVGAAAARLLRVPLLLTLPGGDMANHPSIGYGGRLRVGGRLKLRFATAAADMVTVPSATMREQARQVGIDAVTLPLGVALDRWPPRLPQVRSGAAPVRLLHVGSLNLVKDQMTLLQAAAILKDRGLPFELYVIGWDTLEGTIQRRAVELGLADRVCFRGFTPHTELRRWFEWADLLVVSSVHEAGPLVALEGAVAGVPTVGTAVGHIADFAPEAALAVPVGDYRGLAAAIRRLAADESERLRLAAAAQERACREDADFTAVHFRRFYRDLGAGKAYSYIARRS